MNILITGGGGFVGRNMVRFFAERHSVTLTDLHSDPQDDVRRHSRYVQLDVRDATQVLKTIDAAKCEAVIHLAANKNVRYCEKNPGEAHKINTEGTKNVAIACKRAGIRLAYLSTDLVFDCVTGGYKETDVPHPATVYGKTKLAGEKEALSELPDVAICRSGGIYGPESPLFAWLTTELEAKRPVSCLTNVKNTPTYTRDLGEMLEKIISLGLSGTFHTVGPEAVNRYEWFVAFARAFGLDSSLLHPLDSEQMMHDSFLQPNAALDATLTNALLGMQTTSLKEGMADLRSRTTTAVRAEML
jgi:dTDP-4-dehydrorhamnose reductase